MPAKSVGVAILTLNAEKHLEHVLKPILASSLKPKILVIDSASNDQTLAICKEWGVEVYNIPRNEFNHGLTREKARKVLGTDIVVFLTHDAYLEDGEALIPLVEPLLKSKAAASYARQLPRPGAGLLEAFPRAYNYPEESQLRNISNVKKWGVYTFFISDSCAAYDNASLDTIGGFSDVLYGEDTKACAELLHKGFNIAYVAEARVEHSHDYTLIQEFKRNFDIGLSRKQIEPLLAIAGADSARGQAFAKKLLLESLKTPWITPYVFFHLAAKFLGYKIGQKSVNASATWKRMLSSQPYFFKS